MTVRSLGQKASGASLAFASLLLVAGSVSGAGCRQVLGLHDREDLVDAGPQPHIPVPGTAACGALLYPNAACEGCMDTGSNGASCCAQATACSVDPACAQATHCLAACDEGPTDEGAACRAVCDLEGRSSDPFRAFIACRTQRCDDTCGAPGEGLATATSACELCAKTNCDAQSEQCAANTDCLAADACLTADCRPDNSGLCATACRSAHAAGTAAYDAWTACETGALCHDACQSGNNWSCLGSPQRWPQVSAPGPATVGFRVLDVFQGHPFVNVLVKACPTGDTDCTTSDVVTSATDTNGDVQLTVNIGPNGFDGYFDLSGGQLADDTLSPVYPALWFPYPPYLSGGHKETLHLASSTVYPTTASVAHAGQLLPGYGDVAVAAFDCGLNAGAGVQFSANLMGDQANSYYFVGPIPAPTATGTDRLSGYGGILNLPLGYDAITATVSATNTPLGAPRNVLIRDRTLTVVSIAPVQLAY